MKMPVIRKISFNCVECFKHPSIIHKFLMNSVAKGTKNFGFRVKQRLSKNESKVYVEGVKRVARKITDSLLLSCIWIGQQEFQQIIVSCKYIKELIFFSCAVLTDEECDFKNLLFDSKIQVINFSQTGNSSHWNMNRAQRFKNIVIGFSKEQGIKDNLREIRLSQCWIFRAQAESILIENGLENVRVEGW